MYTFPAALGQAVRDLSSGKTDLPGLIDETCDRIDANEPHIQALLPEENRRERLKKEASVLMQKYPHPHLRPPLFGVLMGVKDMFRVDGFSTRCGSRLPSDLFGGAEAKCVSVLRRAGALILGKTVTTEFAYLEPGPTRNPHNLNHTPGGSSSGSAAAVAAGFCHLALGTQTVASVTRPAAYCGIVGFKPSYGRIPSDGMILFSRSADHAGIFTLDVEGVALSASLLCRDWRPSTQPVTSPVLAVPGGQYLQQVSPEALQAFEGQLETLQRAGYQIKRIPVFEDMDKIASAHFIMISAEMSEHHREWFPRFENLYRPSTAAMLRQGRQVAPSDLEEARRGQALLRARLEALMQDNGVEAWVSPASTGPAPEGIDSTGNPFMSLPWTYSGLPSITVPAGRAPNGLPLGLQLAAPFMADENLFPWAENISTAMQEL